MGLLSCLTVSDLPVKHESWFSSKHMVSACMWRCLTACIAILPSPNLRRKLVCSFQGSLHLQVVLKPDATQGRFLPSARDALTTFG